MVNKEMFIRDLSNALDGYDSVKKEEAIAYYEELIQEYLNMGKSEEEIIRGFGKMEDIVRRLGITKIKDNSSSRSRDDVFEIKEEGNKEKKTDRIDEPRISVAKCTTLLLTSIIWVPILFSLISVVISVCIAVYTLPLALGVASIGVFVGPLIGLPGLTFDVLGVGKAAFLFGLALLSIDLIIVFTKFVVFVGKKIGRFIDNATKKGGWLLYEK